MVAATRQQEPEGDVDELRHALDCGHESEVCEWPRCSCAESVLRQWDAARVQPTVSEEEVLEAFNAHARQVIWLPSLPLEAFRAALEALGIQITPSEEPDDES